MENKFKNKGFTLVELVIVIAVIAILAGVLIPTFSNIIEKANASNDISLVRNINNALELNSSLNELPKDKTELKNVLKEDGINETKNKAKNHIIFWSKSNNMFFIWGIKEERIIFPEYCRNKTLDDFDDEVNINIKENVVFNQIQNAQEYSYGYANGYINNARLKSTSPYIDHNDTLYNGFVATGAIPIDVDQYDSLTIYIAGGEFIKSYNCGAHMIFNSRDLRSIYGEELFSDFLNEDDFKLDFTLIKISDNYYKLVCNNYEEFKTLAESKKVYFAISLKGLGANLIITINEEIYN